MSLEHVDSKNFQSEVLNSKSLVVVDCYADWCAPCRALSPVLEQLQNTNKDKVKIVKLDIESDNETSSKYNITAIPALLFFKEGKLLDTIIGFNKESVMQNKINELM